jgi:hypothetical protein
VNPLIFVHVFFPLIRFSWVFLKLTRKQARALHRVKKFRYDISAAGGTAGGGQRVLTGPTLDGAGAVVLQGA